MPWVLIPAVGGSHSIYNAKHAAHNHCLAANRKKPREKALTPYPDLFFGFSNSEKRPSVQLLSALHLSTHFSLFIRSVYLSIIDRFYHRQIYYPFTATYSRRMEFVRVSLYFITPILFQNSISHNNILGLTISSYN